jgi:hypothetical protein
VRRDWIGGKELFPEEILPSDGVLKACAKDGRDCGMWVAMLPWLIAMVNEEGCEKREREKKTREGLIVKKDGRGGGEEGK